jgi:hypothetical protein
VYGEHLHPSQITDTMEEFAEKIVVLDYLEAVEEIRLSRAVARGISLALTGKSNMPTPFEDEEDDD